MLGLVAEQFLGVLAHPWFWILCQRALGMTEHRGRPGTRANRRPLGEALMDMAVGLAVGAVLTGVLFRLGFLWPGGPAVAGAFLLSGVMGFVHPRFQCMLYGSVVVACFWPEEGMSLLAFGALLHGAEGFLLLIFSGGSRFWPVPLCLWMPREMGTVPMPAWWTPGWPGAYTEGVRFGVFGAALGLRSEGLMGREKASGLYLLAFSVVLLGMLKTVPALAPLTAVIGHELPGFWNQFFPLPGVWKIAGVSKTSGLRRGDIPVAFDGNTELAPYLQGRPFRRVEVLRRGRAVVIDFGTETDTDALGLRFRGNFGEDMDGETLFYGGQQLPGF